MEGTSDVNDSLENSAAAPQIKLKDSNQSQIQENCNLMETPALSESQDRTSLCRSRAKKVKNLRINKSGRRVKYQPSMNPRIICDPEHLCPTRSPKSPSENLEGESNVGCMGSQVRSEHLGTSVRPDENADIVAELTLSNYRTSRLSLDGCSNSRDDGVKKKDWQGLYVAAGDLRSAMSKENLGIEGNRAANFYLNPLKPHGSLQCMQKDYSKVSEISAETGKCFGSEERLTSGGARSKPLEGYRLPEISVKNSLKGKGVSYRYLGAYDSLQTPVQSSRHKMPQTHLDEAHNLIHKSDDLNLPGDVNYSNSYFPRGISLREWIIAEFQNFDKPTRFLIFREILELVDTYHSQGLALLDLSPSFFLLKSPNHVKYIGSVISQSSNISSKVAVDWDAIQCVNQFKRKSNLEADDKHLETVSVKRQKLAENLESGCQYQMFGNSAGWKETSGMDDSTGIKVQDPDCNFWPQFLGDGGYKVGSIPNNIQKPTCDIFQLDGRWYTSPEQMSGSRCSFSSNVYSLGVLLFELFCSFKSQDMRSAAMVNLRHRILPPSFLSESPKEAGFCLWLLHPEPSLRPKSREILLCEFMCETQDLTSIDHALASINEEYAESEMLLHFLLSAKEQKEKRAAELTEEHHCLTTDIYEVEQRKLSRVEHSGLARSQFTSKNLTEPAPPDLSSRIPSSEVNQARLMRSIAQLERAYFSTRSNIDLPASEYVACKDKNVDQKHVKKSTSTGQIDHLGAFFDGLCKYARYNKFEVLGTVRNNDLLSSANVVCSLSFDRDEDYLATAGISKRIKIFDFEALLNYNVDVHYPVVEMVNKSRLSCVCWNSYIKNYLASTDYDGTVQIWDASTGQGFTQFTDHLKRAWSVDFSPEEPTKLASGSDDCSVKLWSIKEKNCISSIRTVANICCVQFSPNSSHLLSFGSADYKIYCYDLRNTRVPLCTLAEHRKAVSYVKFVDSQTLVSASTDNTLKIWDLKKVNYGGLTTESSLTLRGHTNEKNFVGLSVFDGYIACGSETNEVYAYYNTLPMPITSHKFGSIDPVTALEVNEENGQFVSSVCWRGKSNVVVAANSTGCLKLLKMV